MSDLLKKLEHLSPKQRELVLRRLKKQAAVAAGSNTEKEPDIPRQERTTNRFILSFSQLRQWILEQLEPGTAAYNLPGPMQMVGELDVSALEKAIDGVFRHHESLRTTFEPGDEEPVQVIHPPSEFKLPIQDLSDLPEDQRRAEMLRLATEEADTPFDLAKGPLVRMTLVRLAEQEHVLLFTIHHIISDGWSRGVFFRHLDELYDAYRRGDDKALEELPIQYADFSVWQRENLSGDVLESHLGYWRAQLGTPTPLLDLPTDRPRPKVAAFDGGEVDLPLAPELVQALRDLSRKNGCSLFMTLMAAYKALLYRYSRQTDLAVGSFIANRNRSQIADLIGFFVNTLVMRSQHDANSTFLEAMTVERECALGAFAHQDLPFEKLVEELQPERSTGSTPFFQTMFVLQNARGKNLSLGDLELGALGSDHKHSNFDFTMWAWEGDEKITLTMDYRLDLFDEATAQRILGHYATLLEAVVANPSQRLRDLSLLSDAEQTDVVTTWNATEGQAATQPVHRLVTEQAQRTPAAVALEYGAEQITFQELNTQVFRLARHLRQLGVGTESLVAVSLPRSTEQIVALLAVLEAGGAYVPLDPGYPEERIRFMLDDSGASVLITRSEITPDLPTAEQRPAHLRMVLLDRETSAIEAQAAEPLNQETSLDSTAYVIYTSGSTGKPKGVLVPHSSFANYIVDAADAYGVESSDRVLQFASVNFDTSAEEIYPSLMRGATLVLRNEQMIASVDDFLRQLGELNISLLNLPTAFWHQICSELSTSAVGLPQCLRRVIIGGEKATVGHLAEWQQWADAGIDLVNTYGPTEATIVSSRCELAGDGAPQATDLAEQQREIPIGSPLTNARTYVVDRHLQLLPMTVDGELLIGGAGVVRGYLGRAAKTAEQFVPDPFSGRSGARLYRSGDLARWRAEGQLEFRGRTDHQVKVRGFRVELGEIETALGLQPGIRDAVVAAIPMGDDLRLVAYVVAEDPEAQPAVSELKDALKTRLPEYMVPAVFQFLEELPTSPSGKVDRAALPDPDADSSREISYEAPRTTTESLLAGIWEELLATSRVGLHDNFFDLGGHSLLATRLVARVRQTFKAEMPLLTIFDSPQLEEMAREIERLENVDTTPLPPIVRQPRPETTVFPLSFPQERIFVLNELQGDNLAYHFIFILGLIGPVNKDTLQRCLDELVRRHEILRTTFHQDENGRPIQRVHPLPVSATCDHIDLRHMPFEEAARRGSELVSQAGREPFVLAELPLARWMLIHLDENKFMLGQIEHHFMHDGWSVTVFLRELQDLYVAFSEGRPSPLPELPVQFGDFCQWQQELLQGPYYKKLLNYWVSKVGDAERVLEMPLDFPRPRVNRFEGEMIPIVLPQELYQRVTAFHLKHHTSLYITMLSAFYAMLYRYTGQQSLMLGSMIANRRMKEAEALIGMIVNTMLLRGDVDGQITFDGLVQQVRQTVLEAHAHQDMPFEKLVSHLNPERDLSRNPLFQLMFAFHDSQVPEIEFAGIRGILQGAHNNSAKADLNIVVIPKAEQHSGIERSEADEPDHLIMYWEYNTDLFERATIQRMIDHYSTLLDGFVTDPNRRVVDYPMMPAAEQQRIVVDWNQTAVDYSRDLAVHQLFQRQADKTPDAPAISAGSEHLTYGELAGRVHQLAQHLRACGLQSEQVVGVCSDRSANMMISLLAVLEAGGSYLPIDPSFPQDRIAWMLEDSAAPLVITHEELATKLPPNKAQIVLLDGHQQDIAARPKTAPGGQVDPANEAYVIYTSGSTGKPKGVAVPHGALTNFLGSMAQQPGMTADDTLLAVTTISFDIAGLELYLPLIVGGQVVLADRQTAADAELLMKAMNSSGATVMQATPATWQLLFTAGWTGDQNLRVLCGGEALPPLLGRRLEDVCGEVWNLYGPTEATIWSTLMKVEKGDTSTPTVAIGRPIANTQVYVVNDFEPTPIGVPGELLIGGDGLARGYLGRPGMTAERFVPNPFATAGGGRLYRTGDLARYRADGSLLFSGRIDHQVKVRGYRIELGEIETALNSHRGIAQAVVASHKDPLGATSLAAYVVSEEGSALDASALRDHLRQQLPDYMVPGVFVAMDELPMTPNGKVNRRALPKPGYDQSQAKVEFVAPSTPLEEDLHRIWTEALDIERLGVHDNFFELGGHSLLATQIIVRLAAVQEVRVSLVQFFDHPTIAAMASLVESIREHGDGHTAIQKASDGDEIVADAEQMGDEDLDALLSSMMGDDD